MATPLFLLLFLSIIATSIAHPPIPGSSKSNPDFILASCRATQYPALCYHSLSTYADKVQHSERQLALTALAISLGEARSAARFVSHMSRAKGIKHWELEAVKDCIDTMGDSVDQLSHSFKELARSGQTNGEEFMWHMSNVQTWVSAALTDESTCADGLSDGHVKGGLIKGAINTRVSHVAQVTSNALALVNRFAARST